MMRACDAPSDHLRARQACIARPSCDNQRQDHFPDAWTEKRCKRNRKKYSWKGQKGVDQQKIDEAIEPAAGVARDHTHSQSDEPTAANYTDGNEKRNSRAI